MSDEANDHGSLLKQVLTDKGQEFLNKAMAQWYQKRGIVHTRVGPNVSQLYLVERTHQNIIGMVKTMTYQSFWVNSSETAVDIKN